MAKARRVAGQAERIDIRIGKMLGQLSDRPLVKRVRQVAELADQPPLVALSAGTMAVGLILGRPRLAQVGLRMATSHMLATLAKGWIKHRVDRRRPHVERGDHRMTAGRIVDESAHNSFPSGHSAGAVAVASAVIRDYPGAAPIAAGAAGFAVLAQLPAAKHFPIDLVAGVAIGLASDAIVAALLARDDRPAAI